MNVHIIKYAKGHYGQSKNIFKDLTILISKYSGWYPKEMTDEDIIPCVRLVWDEVVECEVKNYFPVKLYEESTVPYNNKKSLSVLIVELMLSNILFIKIGPNGESLKELLPKNHEGIFFGDAKELERTKKQLPDMFGD